MTPAELRIELHTAGWHFGSQYVRDTGVDWYAWKRDEALAHCTSNKKPASLCITPWTISMPDGRTYSSVQFEVTGQVGGDEWMKLQVYSVPMDQCMAKLPRATALLMAAWNAAAAI
jgi:hypothetical protein